MYNLFELKQALNKYNSTDHTEAPEHLHYSKYLYKDNT